MMMMDDEEMEMLLGEIETSSLNLQTTPSRDNNHQYQQSDNHNVVGHGYYNYGHVSYMNVMPEMNSYGLGQCHGAYDDGSFKYISSSSSPVIMNGLHHSPSSRGSSSSSLYHSSPSLGTEDIRPHLNRYQTDLKKANYGSRASYGSSLIDEGYNLAKDFNRRVCLGGGGGNKPDDGVVGMSFGRCGFDDLRNTFREYDGYCLPIARWPLSLEEEADLLEMKCKGSGFDSLYSPKLSDQFVNLSDYANSGLSPQYYRSNVAANNRFPIGYALSDVSRPLLVDTLFNRPRNGYTSDAFCAPNVMVPQYNEESGAFHYQSSQLSSGRNTVPSHGKLSQGEVGAFRGDDSLNIQGHGAANYGMRRPVRSSRARVLHNESGARVYCTLPQLAKCGSLADVKGYIYELAKDQNGCRFLQKVFDTGSPQDVQMIFCEIITHADELMTNAFGNYLMQKFLDVCNEDQRTCILNRVKNELVRISLNTHGTRVVQKLIETLGTRQQTLLMVSALEPGFLALIKDLNGNHVIQRCLQYISNEDNKFIFVAAAKYCVEIASHQHGCCVLQRCISHSTGELREKLVARISADGVLLAQDSYGNYVIQFMLDLKIPSAVSKLTAQFQNNYVMLSTQKFSSHVVEKCLQVCSNDVRARIVHELLSATDFDQLLSHPNANYVVQTALRTTEGALHNSLVDAIESFKSVSRNSPYSKKIFSQKFLRR